MTESTFNFPSPLRLSRGSHMAGSGAGCAMNVVSYENGDTEITDFPSCSAQPLAKMVQTINDTICRHTVAESKLASWLSGSLPPGAALLCPPCSQIVLDLGHATVGTGGYSRRTLNLWLRSILVDPTFGVASRVAEDSPARNMVKAVAALLPDGHPKFLRDAQDQALRFAEYVNISPLVHAVVTTAMFAARAATRVSEVPAVVSAAFYAASCFADPKVYYVGWAIEEWHRVAGTQRPDVSDVAVREAVAKMLQVAP